MKAEPYAFFIPRSLEDNKLSREGRLLSTLRPAENTRSKGGASLPVVESTQVVHKADYPSDFLLLHLMF